MKTGFRRFNNKEMLGYTRLADIQDNQVWQHLLTPQVRALLGAITRYGEPEVMETVAGHFAGDEATNLNLHRLYAGSAEHVRFPYLSTLHRTEYGALVIKRDAVKIKVMGWVGDVFKSKATPIYVCALRDRRYDGSRRANDSALMFFPYDDPKFHRQLTPEARCLELSVYAFVPGSRIASAGEPELDEFIEKPFAFLKRPQLFAELFRRAWKTDRAPGQFAAPIQDVSKKCLSGVEHIAHTYGYDFVECATSHYHVARWFQSRRYRFTYTTHERTMDELGSGIERVRAHMAARGEQLQRHQESWVAVVQSLRPVELIPDGLCLNGPIWPQDNISPESLWMNKPLNARAAELIPGPMEF